MAKAKNSGKTKTASTKSAGKKSAKPKKDAVAPTASAKAGKASPAKTKTTKVKAAETSTKTMRKGKTTPNSDANPVVVVTHDQIARKAYEIWLAKGRPFGQDEANWLEAKAGLENR